jgi:hypothetical protein
MSLGLAAAGATGATAALLLAERKRERERLAAGVGARPCVGLAMRLADREITEAAIMMRRKAAKGGGGERGEEGRCGDGVRRKRKEPQG